MSELKLTRAQKTQLISMVIEALIDENFASIKRKFSDRLGELGILGSDVNTQFISTLAEAQILLFDGAIAVRLVELKLKRDKIVISHEYRRELGNVAKEIGVPLNELLDFMEPRLRPKWTAVFSRTEQPEDSE